MPGQLIPVIAVQKPGDKSVIPRISNRRGRAAVRAPFAGRNRKDGSSERFIALGSLILDTISVEPTMGTSWFSL
jgi:hypothetical protein